LSKDEEVVKKVRGQNLLDLKPMRTKKWRRGEKVTIVVPKARTVLGKHFIDALGMKQTYKINLDDYGSAIWKLCDGKTTVRDIGKTLKKEFGEKVEPLYDRLSAFIGILRNENLIEFVK
jgi:hypothetical protein